MGTEQVIAMLATAVIGFFSGRLQKMADKHGEEVERRERAFLEMRENQRRLLEWQAKMEEQNAKTHKELEHLRSEIKRISNGELVLLRDRIIQSCRTFIKRGRITITARNNIKSMYKSYHDDFGGNGDGEYYFCEMMKLTVDNDVPMVSPFPTQEVDNGDK